MEVLLDKYTRAVWVLFGKLYFTNSIYNDCIIMEFMGNKWKSRIVGYEVEEGMYYKGWSEGLGNCISEGDMSIC